MPGPLEETASLDRLVHEPSRLAILTALSACRTADYRFLQVLTGLSSGNLSNHLAKLEEGGLVTIEKSFRGRMRHTAVRLTASGRESIRRHWTRLKELQQAARRLKQLPIGSR